jgi:hypothetical protein
MAKLTPEEMWERMLTGDFPHLQRMRRIWGCCRHRSLQAL